MFERTCADDYTCSGGLTLAAFVRYCEREFGAIRKVVIKFMRVESQYRREILIRKQGELSGSFVMSFCTGPDEAEFAASTENLTTSGGKVSLSGYKFGLVMPAADRSLDAIYRSERPDIQRVRAIMYEVCLCLQHLHQNGIVHGDLKMLNVLRVNGGIRLIDMDAACRIGLDFVGNKFSSGEFYCL